MDRVGVDVEAAEGVAVSPDLWGIFLEDLNVALDGGLHAELVVNDGFEHSAADRPGGDPLTGWGVDSESALRTVSARVDDPVHPRTAMHVRISGPATLCNDGWEGIPVERDARLRLRFASRAPRGSALLHVGIADSGRALVEKVAITIEPGSWAWYEVDLVGLRQSRGRFGEHCYTVDLGGDGPETALSIEISAWRNDHSIVKRRYRACHPSRQRDR